MDAFAYGLKVAANLWNDRVLEDFVDNRYRSYNSGIGADIVAGKVGLKELSEYVLNKGQIEKNESGKQEYLESVVNQYIINTK